MARDITEDFEAEIKKRVAYPLFLWEGFFGSGRVGFFNGIGTLTWPAEGDPDSRVWHGAGTIWSFETAAETPEIAAEGARFTLSGLDQETMAIAENEDYSERACRLWIGAATEDGEVISDPALDFEGFMDVIESEEDGETARLVMTAESEMVLLEIANEWRYTQEDQQNFGGLAEALSVEDNFFSKVASLQEAQVQWG